MCPWEKQLPPLPDPDVLSCEAQVSKLCIALAGQQHDKHAVKELKSLHGQHPILNWHLGLETSTAFRKKQVQCWLMVRSASSASGVISHHFPLEAMQLQQLQHINFLAECVPRLH